MYQHLFWDYWLKCIHSEQTAGGLVLTAKGRNGSLFCLTSYYTQSSKFIIRILTRTRRIHWQIQMYLRTDSGVIREKDGLLSSWDVWITVFNDLDHSFCNYINLCASFPIDLKSPNSFHHNDDWILHIVTCCELGLAKTSCENNVDIFKMIWWTSTSSSYVGNITGHLETCLWPPDEFKICL